MRSTIHRISDGLRRRLHYSNVRARPGIVLREFDVRGQRMLVGDVDGSVAAEVVAGEIGHGAYDFADIPLRAGDVVIDVGAHIGVVSVYLAKAFPGISVLAYEPMPQVFQLLVENLARNRVHNVTAYNLAVTGDGRDIEMVAHLPSNTGGGTTYAASHDLPGHERVTVHSTTLDGIIGEHEVSSCPLLKIDVEGAEYEVLYNARTLAKIRNIRGEFHANAYLRSRGFDMDELKDYCDRIIGPGHTRFTRCTMPDL